ncbi:MAG: N-acetylmuramoyl-L-alanine amidase [Chloroflexota bacterium]
MFIKDHFLYYRDGEQCRFIESPNVGDPTRGDCNEIDHKLIVLHYTATPVDGQQAIEILTDKQRAVSAHFVVTGNGTITQLVPTNIIAWHAGKSVWGGFQNLNPYSIGIEIANPGKLSLHEDGQFYTWYNQPVDACNLVEAAHNFSPDIQEMWHTYPEEQYRAVVKLTRVLVEAYRIQYEHQVVGHDDISWPRKCDPGPAWPMADFKHEVFYR